MALINTGQGIQADAGQAAAALFNDVDSLIGQLGSSDAEQRRQAARQLADFPGGVQPLIRQLGQETSPSVRESIFVSLTLIGNSAAMDGLVACLRSNDAAIRNEAIEAMKSLPNSVAPIMASLLRDPDPDVRIFTVNVLESLKHPEVERWLIDVITRDPHVNVCAAAVDLLGELGTEAAIAPLEALRKRFADVPYIGFAAFLALKRIREA